MREIAAPKQANKTVTPTESGFHFYSITKLVTPINLARSVPFVGGGFQICSIWLIGYVDPRRLQTVLRNSPKTQVSKLSGRDVAWFSSVRMSTRRENWHAIAYDIVSEVIGWSRILFSELSNRVSRRNIYSVVLRHTQKSFCLFLFQWVFCTLATCVIVFIQFVATYGYPISTQTLHIESIESFYEVLQHSYSMLQYPKTLESSKIISCCCK